MLFYHGSLHSHYMKADIILINCSSDWNIDYERSTDLHMIIHLIFHMADVIKRTIELEP